MLVMMEKIKNSLASLGLLADLTPKVSRRSTKGKPISKSPPKVYLKRWGESVGC
jgi:hypothetical protein